MTDNLPRNKKIQAHMPLTSTQARLGDSVMVGSENQYLNLDLQEAKR
jgi:hypothetical protein